MIDKKALQKAVVGRKVLVDSDIIIYLTDSIQPYDVPAQWLFKWIEAGDASAVISVLSVSEVMQGPLRKSDYSIAKEVRDYLVNFPNAHCQEITKEVLEMVGDDERIKWEGLRSVDSLIIACGLANQVDLFISNDAHFRKSIHSDYLLSLV